MQRKMEVVKPTLCSVMWWVTLCLLASPVQSHQYNSELEISDLQYSRVKTDDPKIGVQLSDVLEFQLDSASDKEINVSLFLYDAKERVWQEAGHNKNDKGSENGSKMITLTKPLIGYDLMTANGCGGDNMKTQPFTKERWGTKEEREEWARCYMVAVSADDYSVFKTYPDNCVEESRKNKQGEGDLPDLDLNAEDHILPHEEASHYIPKRSTSVTSIVQFKKEKVEDDRKFTCKVTQNHMGASLSLGNGIPSADVKVYYKPNNNANWGSHLLELQWVSYSNGENKYVSKVSKQHLNGQGVMWKKCFKCEVTVNGVVNRQCLGSCTCN